MLSLNLLFQITSCASCKLHTLQMVESGASGKVAVAQQKIDKSHLSARFAKKFCSARAKYQVAAAQRNQKQDSINYNSIANSPGDSCATLAAGGCFSQKQGWNFVSAKSGGEIVLVAIFYRDTRSPTHLPPVFVSQWAEVYGWLKMIRQLYFHKQSISLRGFSMENLRLGWVLQPAHCLLYVAPALEKWHLAGSRNFTLSHFHLFTLSHDCCSSFS